MRPLGSRSARRHTRRRAALVVAILVLTGWSVGAALDEYWLAYDILAVATLFLVGRTLYEGACAVSALQRALQRGFGDTP
jgi:hypothetical protein